jgi:hypothetical protein
MLIKQQVLDNGWGPGGWQFFQPETNWHAPHPMGTTFKQQVENIRKHRAANPRFPFSTDPVLIAQELEEYTLTRWRKTYSEHGMQKFLERPDDALKKKHSEWIGTSRQPQSLLGKVAAHAGIDTSTVEDWFGEGGKPVSLELATGRAYICTQCQGNRKVGWRDLLTIAGAKTLRAYFAVKNEMKLSTAFDKDLGMCKACDCVMEFKVHTPLQSIMKTTSIEKVAKLQELNPNCWILNETP